MVNLGNNPGLAGREVEACYMERKDEIPSMTQGITGF